MSCRRYSPSTLITLKELITRWPGVTEHEFSEMVKSRKLPALKVKKRLKSDNGDVWYFCKKCFSVKLDGERICEQDAKDTAFEVVDIENIETIDEEYKWERVRADGCLDAHSISKCAIQQEGKRKTGKATEAASEKRVEAWRGYADQMIKVALDCALEGPRERKRPTLQKMAKKYGEELPSVALEVLWKALPSEHRSSSPGPQRQD